jgi:hypothetical protein
MFNTLNTVACKVLDYITALLFSIIAIVLGLGGFAGVLVSAIYYQGNTNMQLIGVVTCLLAMWSSILVMRQIEALDL